MLTIDELLPAPHFRERHERRIAAPPAAVWQAMQELCLGDLLLSRALMGIRLLPARLAGRTQPSRMVSGRLLEEGPVPVLAAASDPRVGPVLERVTVARLAALEELFGDAGLEPAEARRRARVAYALYVGVIDLRRAAPSARLAEEEIEAEIELMVSALVRAR